MTRREPILDRLPDFEAWRRSNPGLSLAAYAYHNLTADLAIAVTKVFWPDFVTYSDRVFFAESFSKELFELWSKETRGDLQAVERAINHRHVSDMLRVSSELGFLNIVYFGEVLVQCWGAKLKQDFPSWTFKVIGEADQDAEDYTITFSQVGENRSD